MDEGLLNDLLECSVCLERLDTSSRVLPCQHTFCLKCLKVIVESHKELRCPECRVLVEAKVEELPPNVLLMRILEGMRNAPRKPTGIGQRILRAGHGHQSQVQPGHTAVRAGDGKQLPPHARAMYDYISKEAGDLSFKKGETILLLKRLDPFWYQGECAGRSGMFPITYVQIVVPLPVPTALCKALYDFRMSAPDEEGCLAFDKGAIITVHRRVDENWAEGRLDERLGIFPIAFVDLNAAARQLMNSPTVPRPAPPAPDGPRALDTRHAQHPQRYQQMSMSTPATIQGNYQNVATMSQSHPNYHQTPILAPQSQIMVSQSVGQHGLVTTTAVPRNIMEPTNTKHLELIHFTNMHNKSGHHGTVGLQSVSRINDGYDRLRTVKYDSYNSTPVHHKAETTYQNVRQPTAANFTANSSDSSSSMNTPTVGISSTTSPNTSSNTSSCESAEPSLPSSPDNNTATVTQNNSVANEENPDLNSSMGVLSLNESSTATNTSLNVSLPEQSESQEASVQKNEPSRLEAAPSSSGQNAVQGRAHKRHSLTPGVMLANHHVTPNRHSAEILATSLLDHVPERDRERPDRERERERRRRRSRSNERPLPATYIALYPYKPQKPDELELKKGGLYSVSERCRDGWFKGSSERSQRHGVFPGNYVAPAPHAQLRHDKVAPPAAPLAPPRAHDADIGQPSSSPWNTAQAQLATANSDKPHKDKCKVEKSSLSSGVSLMKRLAAMKKCKSPPPVGYSMDNPVFEDGPSVLVSSPHHQHPVHVRSGSCPSQLLGAGSSQRLRARERPTILTQHDRPSTDNPWQSQHRKSQSLDVTAARRERDRHHGQQVKERFRCIVPYPPNSEYELELKVDDIVLVHRKRGDGWYKGTLQRTGRTGLFPSSFVQSCPAE